MTVQELVAWLEAHEEIYSFMDYETTIETEKELADTLGYWFGSKRWASDGDRFIHLGIDGTGSQFAMWLRPGHTEGPVVFLGSEGGTGALASNCENWAKIIAHAPFIDENADDGERIVSADGNYKLDFENLTSEEVLESKEALQTYQTAILEHFGTLPELDELTSGLEEIHAEFQAWVESKVDH